jgi:carbamoyl-phosphate synthase small subunit
MKQIRKGRLILEDGTVYEGRVFGAPRPTSGEVVFNTGMVGYPESLTDPSYFGQILVFTYPLIGNYGVPKPPADRELPPPFESRRIQVRGLVVATYSGEYSHWSAGRSLGTWLQDEGIPALEGIDTRALTKKLREKGTMLGKIVVDGEEEPEFYDPNRENLVQQVSFPEPTRYGKGKHRIVLYDCGCKESILRDLLRLNVEVLRVPWDFELEQADADAVFLSNGPGDPKMCRKTVLQIRKALQANIPVFGVCLGNQLLALAAGANTYKLKFGHRSQNQPVQDLQNGHGFVTSQNHGYAVDTATLPPEWEPWFINLNDGTNEGIRHRSGRFRSVQFHPEASPGPEDSKYLLEEFIAGLKHGT